jgi:mannosyltransferase OCH1-like enzyme
MKQIANFTSVRFFEPIIDKDFPAVTSNTPRIPHIIHQTYKTHLIPRQLGDYVHSLVKLNPNWSYYFWTDTSSRKFVAERFPTLLQMWDNYRRPINRADAIRYLILYEFGGFYADFDVQCMRPLDNVTFNYACIIPPEPFEQSVFRIKIPYLLNNAIMMCRPKHPFFKQIINSLHQYAPMLEQLDVAGPTFVTSQFIRYNNITAESVYRLKETNESNSPYFYKGELREEDDDAVYVPNTQYFMNSLSQTWMNE